MSLKFTETTQRVPQKVITSSRKVDECKPVKQTIVRPCLLLLLRGAVLRRLLLLLELLGLLELLLLLLGLTVMGC